MRYVCRSPHRPHPHLTRISATYSLIPSPLPSSLLAPLPSLQSLHPCKTFPSVPFPFLSFLFLFYLITSPNSSPPWSSVHTLLPPHFPFFQTPLLSPFPPILGSLSTLFFLLSSPHFKPLLPFLLLPVITVHALLLSSPFLLPSPPHPLTPLPATVHGPRKHKSQASNIKSTA